MTKILTAAEMRAIDARTIEAGLPDLVLMENAAHRVVEVLEREFAPLDQQRIVIFAGKGNNGGDGLAIARLLHSRFAPRALDVVLAADVGALGPQLAALPEVDVLIEAGGYESRLDPVDVDGSVWIRPEAGWRHLGELHVFGVGQPSWSVLDRRVEIDADLPRGRGVQRLLRAWSARRIEED